MMRHLTWRGRASVLYYALRRCIVPRPPAGQRCVMGSTVDPICWCPRRSQPGSIWCKKHEPTPGIVRFRP